MTSAPKMGRGVLWVLPLVLVPAAFAASLPWLTTISKTAALLITAAATIFVMGYAHYLGFRSQRGLDEVQRAGAAFAAQWGAPAGQAAFALLLLLPPFKDLATTLVGRVADPATSAAGTLVLVAMALAFCTVVLLQAIGTVVAHAFWWTIKR